MSNLNVHQGDLDWPSCHTRCKERPAGISLARHPGSLPRIPHPSEYYLIDTATSGVREMPPSNSCVAHAQSFGNGKADFSARQKGAWTKESSTEKCEDAMPAPLWRSTQRVMFTAAPWVPVRCRVDSLGAKLFLVVRLVCMAFSYWREL